MLMEQRAGILRPLQFIAEALPCFTVVIALNPPFLGSLATCDQLVSGGGVEAGKTSRAEKGPDWNRLNFCGNFH